MKKKNKEIKETTPIIGQRLSIKAPERESIIVLPSSEIKEKERKDIAEVETEKERKDIAEVETEKERKDIAEVETIINMKLNKELNEELNEEIERKRFELAFFEEKLDLKKKRKR